MKRIALMGLLLSLFALSGACKKEKEADKAGQEELTSTDTADNPPQQPSPTKMAGGELVKRVEECWAAFAAWDKNKYRACYAESIDVKAVNAVPPDTSKTPQEVIALYGVFRSAFPDFRADVQLVLASGKKAASVAHISGTHKGGSLGMPPTNKVMSMLYGQVVEVDQQGRIVRARNYADQTTLLHQLGIQEGLNVPTKEKGWPETPRMVAKDDEAEKANIATVQSSLDALAQGDETTAMNMYADSARYRYIPESVPFVGKNEIAKARGYAATNKDIQVEVRDTWAAGNWVVAETTLKATLKNDLPGATGTKGKSWEQSSLELFEFAEGKVVRHLVFTNGLKFAVDVGLVDPEALGLSAE